jgi:hypothetical protein
LRRNKITGKSQTASIQGLDVPGVYPILEHSTLALASSVSFNVLQPCAVKQCQLRRNKITGKLQTGSLQGLDVPGVYPILEHSTLALASSVPFQCSLTVCCQAMSVAKK